MGNQNSIQLGVGAVVFKDDAVLLVKRKNPPNQDQWAIPGGKVKFGEPLIEAVQREIQEETGVVIVAQKPVYTFEVIENSLHYVVIDFTANYVTGEPQAADDAQDAAWVSRENFRSYDINQITRTLLATQFNFP